MRIVKPLRLGLLTRPFLHAGTVDLTVSLLWYFPFDAPREIQTEGSMWEELMPILGNAPLDACEPKAHGEVLVWGDYCAPGGEPMLQHGVRLSLGPVDKTLRVTGPRQWVVDDSGGLSATDPEPIVRQKLGWDIAFGGPGFAENPAGIGHWPDGLQADRYPLPMLEYPDDTLALPQDVIAPAGFGPRDPMLPSRQKLTGTYDEYWQAHHMPGFPEDLDFRFFQVAPEDQQLSGWLSGTEPFALEHMHPDHEVQTGRLPGVRGRCFARLRDAEGTLELVEVPLVTDTVCLFPGIERGVVIQRGRVRVRDIDLHDVDAVLAAFEWQEQTPRPVEYYEEVLRRRSQDGVADLGLLDFSDMCPEGWEEPPERKATWFTVMQPRPLALPPSIQAEMAEFDEQVQQYAQQAEQPPPNPSLQPGDLRDEPASAQTLQDEVAAMRAMPLSLGSFGEFDAQFDRMIAAARQYNDDRTRQVIDEARAFFAANGLDYDQVMAEAANAGPHTPREMMQLLCREHDEAMAATPLEYRAALAECAPHPLVEQVERDMAELQQVDTFMRSKIGHMIPLPPLPAPQIALDRQQAVGAALAQGTLPADGAYGGLDLSGADFGGRDLSKADFTNCTLTGARFDGAILKDACFAHARLTGASLVEADASGANFGHADLSGADASRALFRDAQFAQSRATETLFAGADFTDTTLLELEWEAADLTGALFTGAFFLKVRLIDVRMDGADLTKAGFIECHLPRLSLRGATMVRTGIIDCDLTGADFSEAQTERLSTLKDIRLDEARFDGAKLPGASLIGASLRHASFRNADMVGALLNEAVLDDADLSGADLRNALLMRTSLVRARLDSADLRMANLMKADLGDASARNASFYQAELRDALLDGLVLDGALVEMSRLAGSDA